MKIELSLNILLVFELKTEYKPIKYELMSNPLYYPVKNLKLQNDFTIYSEERNTVSRELHNCPKYPCV